MRPVTYRVLELQTTRNLGKVRYQRRMVQKNPPISARLNKSPIGNLRGTGV